MICINSYNRTCNLSKNSNSSWSNTLVHRLNIGPFLAMSFAFDIDEDENGDPRADDNDDDLTMNTFYDRWHKFWNNFTRNGFAVFSCCCRRRRRLHLCCWSEYWKQPNRLPKIGYLSDLVKPTSQRIDLPRAYCHNIQYNLQNVHETRLRAKCYRKSIILLIFVNTHKTTAFLLNRRTLETTNTSPH